MSSQAICDLEYYWAENREGYGPCEVAAVTSMACMPIEFWVVPPLIPGNHYDSPTFRNGTVNPCTCSWATYNLMSMCTICQDFPKSVLSWAAYSAECGNFTLNTYVLCCILSLS
ncbi:hypothetical protein GYMLUDRAFT_153176 [Collybiopsis luxurians FD-317 M1]|nr:hypothetical protein GYMLUDRAFT_153176 [Collybiopsis luxurians FD-317 M1]